MKGGTSVPGTCAHSDSNFCGRRVARVCARQHFRQQARAFAVGEQEEHVTGRLARSFAAPLRRHSGVVKMRFHRIAVSAGRARQLLAS